jgi:hypothetical protein
MTKPFKYLPLPLDDLASSMTLIANPAMLLQSVQRSIIQQSSPIIIQLFAGVNDSRSELLKAKQPSPNLPPQRTMAPLQTILLTLLTTTTLALAAACPAKPNPNPGEVCGPTICAEGLTCCNPSCGYCTKPGEGCTEEACNIGIGPQCGPTVCPFGEVCCNESCGYCTKPGQGCTAELCLGPKCGAEKVCKFGEVCCNESCGYCTKPGEGCTTEICLK